MNQSKLFRVAYENDHMMLEDAQHNFYEDDIVNTFSEGDIIELEGEGVRLLYNACEHFGTIFITNHCNSSCVMCPDSDAFRSMPSGYELNRILDFVKLLPENVEGLDITGGEPTLITYDLPIILNSIYEKREYLQIMLLSNGRSFADRSYTEQFREYGKKGLFIEIPIHGSYAELHEEITRGKGGYNQTMAGIRNLLNAGVKVGIRLVVTKQNYDDLKNIVQLVSEKFPEIPYINIMGMECLGNAYSNRDKVWIDFDSIKEVVEETVEVCVLHGIEPRLFNFPLCLFKEKYWGCYRKSITPSKVRYLAECEGCSLKRDCGGFFRSTMKITKFRPESRR